MDKFMEANNYVKKGTGVSTSSDKEIVGEFYVGTSAEVLDTHEKLRRATASRS